MGTLIEFREVCKYYQMGDTTVKAADHISFQIRKGVTSWTTRLQAPASVTSTPPPAR